MTFTASGAMRTGYEYQDLQSAEVLIQWLEQPESYRWVRLETMEGSLDDIQTERSDGTRQLFQVKFGTDASVMWDWDELTNQASGKRGAKPSLLQKWKSSLDSVRSSGVVVSEAALLTNREACAEIRVRLSDTGLIDFNALSDSLKAKLASQLGGISDATKFFGTFSFCFRERSYETLEASLRERFRKLGGKNDGWANLLRAIRRWINRQDEPSPDGKITLVNIRDAALWHLPPVIPQGFIVPDDYVPPETWSSQHVMPRIRGGGAPVTVVTGSPGGGKSTYLSWLVHELDQKKGAVVRHHFFLSLTDPTVMRTSWEIAAESLIAQLRTSYPDLVRDIDCQNPVPETLRKYLEVAGRSLADAKGEPLVVIVDGLDHVWRDTGSADGLRRLFDILLPAPDGVTIVIGTQNVDIARLPLKLRDHCPRDQWLEIPVLGDEEILMWLQCHVDDLGLPTDSEHSERVLSELTVAFRAVTGGHPLLLHYTLAVSSQDGHSVKPDQVKTMPIWEPSNPIFAYYQKLWQDISSEGHQLLHLLAGFAWAWPRDGLVQCLAPRAADLGQFERAEKAVRHVLGTIPVGVTAFHESLLVFIRGLPEHSATSTALRPQVIEWLANQAPEYWRWRHEWEVRAKSGDAAPLITGATLDWCVNSLVAGRGRIEIGRVVAASGWAALAAADLGRATELHYLDAYLDESGHAVGAISRLTWLAFHGRNPQTLELDLNLFLSRLSETSVAEIEAVAEVAFSAGHVHVCRELLDECAERWNFSIGHPARVRSDDPLDPLKHTMPSIIAASLRTPSDGPYQRFISEHNAEPGWCMTGHYSKALARYCVLGRSTKAHREELRFLANHPDKVSFNAVDEILRLACREHFDADKWIQSAIARTSELFRCYRTWIGRIDSFPDESPREISFVSASEGRIGQDESEFIELARAFFFSCLACAIEGRTLPQPIGLKAKADKAALFLGLIREIAAAAAADKRIGKTIGGAWLINRLATIERLDVQANDYDNRMVRPKALAQITVAIAQDLEVLHFAETKQWSLTSSTLIKSLESKWTWELTWIEDRVERRLTMGNADAARFLIDRHRNGLENGRDYLHTRAEEYATLAQFCHLHREPSGSVMELSRRAARNLLGHGFHKDLILYDVLEAIRAVPGATADQMLSRLGQLSPVIQVVDEITDGDETRHLKRELAEVIIEVAPSAFPPFIRALQRNRNHWEVETCFTELCRSAPLSNVYDRALVHTLVHEEALIALATRAAAGDAEAADALKDTLKLMGRASPPVRKPESETTRSVIKSDIIPLRIMDYPPSRLSDYVQALRDVNIYGDEELAEWTKYWSAADPDGLLGALASYRSTHRFPHENLTAKLVVELALERSGPDAAWEWLVAYHYGVFGWSLHSYSLKYVEWIWEIVQDRFPDRWLDFIRETSRPRWGSAGGAPAWSIFRMVRYLEAMGKVPQIADLVEAAARWCSGLAADMVLPDSSLTSSQPDLPIALQLLVDRLDCPSRMVQERACFSLAGLLADPDTRETTTRALIDWHATEPSEMRSCVLLEILLLARSAYEASAETCITLVRQANLTPSIGADLLMRELGDEGHILADSLDYRKRNSGRPAPNFPGVDDFGLTVEAHLAPIFRDWAGILDEAGISFLRQWEWEAHGLAQRSGLSLKLNAHFEHHYLGGVGGPALAINDRIAMLLRSSYLRALHWSIDEAGLQSERAKIHARRIAVMVDPELWAVAPGERPAWWPDDPGHEDGIDRLGEVIGKAIQERLECVIGEDVLLFASGPVRVNEQFRAQVTIRAFFQAAHGPRKPHQSEIAEIPWIGCRLAPPRISFPGKYVLSGEAAGLVGEWLLAPLACRLDADAHDWLLPERAITGIHLPVAWMFPSAPVAVKALNQILVTSGEETAARYSYWHDELRERHFMRAGSRVGAVLSASRKWLEPHLAAGAELCWVVTLSISQREKYVDRFGEPKIIATQLVGGSQILRPNPWRPPN